MSNDYVDYVMELIYEDIDSKDNKGLLDDKNKYIGQGTPPSSR